MTTGDRRTAPASLAGDHPAVQQREPEVVTTERVDWMIYDRETDGYLFSGDRVDCERWMQRLWNSRPTAVLVRENVRTRSQTWRTERQVVPWVSRCDWIAEGDGEGRQIGLAHCIAHNHREGEPIPAEAWRPAQNDGGSDA